MRRAILPAALLILLTSAPASAQQWARKMFETTSHDFGSVARSAKTEFRFVLKNIYIEDVHIASVRSSCGCTTPTIEQDSLKTYETSAIVAKFNSHKFLGRKGATVTVTFDKPFYAEVQLHVTGYIRSDVVFQPNGVELGTINEGQPAETTIEVHYAGRSDWQIVDVRSANPHLRGAVSEIRRGGGRVAYHLLVEMDENAPAGYLQDHLVLVTNDYNMTEVPVPVSARVLGALTVSPSSMFLGVVHPGDTVTKRLIVRGSTPFRIVGIHSDTDNIQVDPTVFEGAKELHIVPLVFVAGDEPGKVSHRIQIETDLGDRGAEMVAHALISP